MIPDSKQALKQFFGFDQFLEGQYEAVRRLNENKDICLVMPTGAGKSICYQLPALMRPGYSIVISPLIALMKDQVDSLVNRGISAVFINSSLNEREQAENLGKAIRGEAKLLYVAPERLRSRQFRQIIQHTPPDMLIVDEAHCISQWGHDFRPDYARVGEFCEAMNIKQVCAFTATATEVVREDIRTQLKRPEMEFMVTGFTRPNLSFMVQHCSGNQRDVTLRKLLAEKVPTLIYCSSRKNVDEICSTFSIRAYHAGLTDKEREDAQNYFINDPCPMMVATNAFGMGIDRPDIRRVIHYNYPGSLEAYYQEAGRAGRDGEQSECIMLFNYPDIHIHEFLIEMNNPGEQLVRQTWSYLRNVTIQSGETRHEILQADISTNVDKARNEQQISGALKILEKNLYIERGFRQQNKGTLSSSQNLQQLYAQHANVRTQRSIFITKIIQYWKAELTKGIEVNYQDLEQISGLDSDQVKRVLRALNGNEINWTTPFSGRSITVLREEPDIEIDFTELNKKAEMDYDKLNKVLAYMQSRQCRQNYMISYFGQSEEDYRCQTCDNCLTNRHGSVQLRQASLEEQQVLKIILRSAERHNGFIGKVKLAAMLHGSSSKQIIDSKLNFSPFYGKLSKLSETDIIELIKSLESFGYLDRGTGKYPTVSLADRGYGAINGGDITMEFKAESKKAPKKEKSGPLFGRKKAPVEDTSEVFSVDDDTSSTSEPTFSEALYNELRELRNDIARETYIQPFQVLNNQSLKELATFKPKDLDSIKTIHGIGQVKADMYGEIFLKTIKNSTNS